MSLALTERAKLAVNAAQKEPNIVLEIEGVDDLYGAIIIKKVARIGDTSLIIGDPATDIGAFFIGGLAEIDGQVNGVTMDGTTNSIRQTLDIDLGKGGSISTMSVALMDGDGSITRLITPGEMIPDILQARCKVYLGFKDVAWPEDYVVIFRGVVTDVTSDAGKVVLQLNHPDDKKQGSIFKNVKPKNSQALTSTQTFIQLDTIVDLLQRVAGPDGNYDDDTFASCLLIENELINYLNIIEASSFTATMTINSPCVVTHASHGLQNDQAIYFTTTGALPTGLSVNTTYYILNKSDNTFQLALTAGGAAINTTGSQSGVHTVNVLAGVGNCTRGYLSTVATTHDAGDASSFYRLMGNCIDLALKLMSSTGDGSFYLEELQATNFENVDGVAIPNSIYFQFTNLVTYHNVQIGDFVTVSGASNGANNCTLKEILDVIETDSGAYILVDDVTFVSELATDAVVSFRSKYDTLPDGLALINDEIDIDEHVRLQQLFLGDFSYDFYLKDVIDDTRAFIENEIYSPVAAFSLPRKSRCSLGYHIGPIPGQDIKTFDITNIKEPSKMKLKRSTNRQFYNEIVYEWDESSLTTDFLSGLITISETSKAQIRGYNKTLKINSKGLRTTGSANEIAASQSLRRLKRYQFAAEVLTFSTLFADGFNVEIGDIIIVDGTDLKLPDIKTATKGMAARYFFVQNKTLNFKTGDVSLEVIDTNFSGTGRYGLISPSSLVVSGASSTQFTIGESFSGKFGAAEHKKWTNLRLADVRVRSADFSLTANTKIIDITTNDVTVSPALPWTPSDGMIMELVPYSDQTLDRVKQVYVHMRDSDFADGQHQYVML